MPALADKFLEWGESNGIFYGSPMRETQPSPKMRRATSSQRISENAEYQPRTLTVRRDKGEASVARGKRGARKRGRGRSRLLQARLCHDGACLIPMLCSC